MARTKASVGAKISSGKSSKARCSAAPPPSSSSAAGTSDKSRNTAGGNPVCPRETPKWQRPITNFFINKPNSEDDTAGSSKSKPKKNIIHSDDEDTDKPKNRELDETIELEPLSGEDSHKIQEYYTKDKIKGKGSAGSSKSKPKKNIIHSDDEDTDKPKNRELDETIELEPLSGEDSHKIQEYYTKDKIKGKGSGKKSNKENVDRNKRSLDISDNEPAFKKIKVI